MVLGHARDDRCAMGLIKCAYFMAVTAQVTPLDRPIVLFTQQLLQYQGVLWELGAAVRTFVGEALH